MILCVRVSAWVTNNLKLSDRPSIKKIFNIFGGLVCVPLLLFQVLNIIHEEFLGGCVLVPLLL